jgi:hypothetical protein
MARTLTQVYEALIAGKEANSDLDSLTPNPETLSSLYTYTNFKSLANSVIRGLSTSKVAIWRLIMYVTAFAIWSQESLYDVFTTEVEATIANREYGQLPWYVDRAKEFQLGDQLTWIDDSYYGYATIDEDLQIVTQAAATVSNGTVYVKVAKGTVGSLEKLTSDETDAFEKYMKGSQEAYSEDGIAPAGTKLEIISTDPDELRFAIEVFYDAIVLDSNGVLLSDGTTKPVEVAITNYIQQIPFDSKFRIIDLVDAIQAADGVVNVVVDNCDAKNSTQAWVDATDVTTATGQQYATYAGYLTMGTNYDLDEYYDYPTNLVPTITYTAEE